MIGKETLARFGEDIERMSRLQKCNKELLSAFDERLRVGRFGLLLWWTKNYYGLLVMLYNDQSAGKRIDEGAAAYLIESIGEFMKQMSIIEAEIYHPQTLEVYSEDRASEDDSSSYEEA